MAATAVEAPPDKLPQMDSTYLSPKPPRVAAGFSLFPKGSVDAVFPRLESSGTCRKIDVFCFQMPLTNVRLALFLANKLPEFMHYNSGFRPAVKGE
jgi:hypothetical protein